MIAELAFDNAEGVLDLGSDGPIFSVAYVLRPRQGVGSLTLIFDRPENDVSPRCPFAIVAHVALVAKDRSIIRADQVICQACIMDLGRGGCDGVYQPAFSVHADMRLQPEILLIAFLCLAHLRVTLVGLVFGRGRGGDQGVFDNGAATHQKGSVLRIAGNGIKQSFGEVVSLHKVSKVQDGHLIGNGILGQIELHKITHRMHVIKRALCPRIGQAIPLLKVINPQHHRRGIFVRPLRGLV